jgi:hypothetical protein
MDKNADQKSIYNSGLNLRDWISLRDALWPFIYAKDPSAISIPDVPPHLEHHPLIKTIQKYRETNDENDLVRAGQYLAPTNKSFGWYVVITK